METEQRKTWTRRVFWSCFKSLSLSLRAEEFMATITSGGCTAVCKPSLGRVARYGVQED